MNFQEDIIGSGLFIGYIWIVMFIFHELKDSKFDKNFQMFFYPLLQVYDLRKFLDKLLCIDDNFLSFIFLAKVTEFL